MRFWNAFLENGLIICVIIAELYAYYSNKGSRARIGRRKGLAGAGLVRDKGSRARIGRRKGLAGADLWEIRARGAESMRNRPRGRPAGAQKAPRSGARGFNLYLINLIFLPASSGNFSNQPLGAIYNSTAYLTIVLPVHEPVDYSNEWLE